MTVSCCGRVGEAYDEVMHDISDDEREDARREAITDRLYASGRWRHSEYVCVNARCPGADQDEDDEGLVCLHAFTAEEERICAASMDGPEEWEDGSTCPRCGEQSVPLDDAARQGMRYEFA